MHGDVESRVATLAAAADANAARTAEEISSRVKEAVEYSDAQASRVAADVTQRLEKEIVAAATSTAATAEITMRTVVEGVRRDIQAQLEQTRVDSLRRETEAQHRIEDISKQLQALTEQLNKFQPASEHAVGVSQGKLSDQVQQQFDAQQDRIQKLSDVVLESRKEAQTNADTLHNLLVGIENLGENVKNMQEEMIAWQAGYQEAEREYEEMNEDLLKEVPLPAQAVRPQGVVNSLPVSIPLVPTSQFTIPSPGRLPYSTAGPSMEDTRQSDWARLSALKKSYPGAPPPVNWFPEGLNVTSAVQVSQATIPQFFNFIGSSSGMMPPTVQMSTGMEQNTSIPDLSQTVGFPPKLLETYSQQMEKVRGL